MKFALSPSECFDRDCLPISLSISVKVVDDPSHIDVFELSRKYLETRIRPLYN